MTLRERILAVYRGETPDTVPFMLDLSHWLYHKHHQQWDLSQVYDKPEYDLIAYHKTMGVGYYLPNLGAFYYATYAPDVLAETVKTTRNGQPEICWRFETPLGSIERRRVWEEQTYSWAISKWGVKTEQDLRVLGYAMSSRTFAPCWDRYRAWADAVDDGGVVYLPIGYSAMGYIMHSWMGVTEVMYAMVDCPNVLKSVIDQINDNILDLVDLAATSPAEIILLGDNFSSDLQPPHVFATWSRAFYAEAIRRLHAAGKYVAVHIDGRLRGSLSMIDAVDADCADAVTPQPMGDLSAEACREEAGTRFILSGGVSPNLWLPESDEASFRRAVMDWLELRRVSPRLIANAGDQVPPNAVEDRISIMRDMVEQYGRY